MAADPSRPFRARSSNAADAPVGLRRPAAITLTSRAARISDPSDGELRGAVATITLTSSTARIRYDIGPWLPFLMS